METLIIEHLDGATSKIFKQMAKVLGLSIKTKTEHLQRPDATITNPELIRRIEAYESNSNQGQSFTLDQLKDKIQNLSSHA